MWQLGNRSTSTDGYGFLGLLYGANAGLANLSRFKQADYDRLYDAVASRSPTARNARSSCAQMSEIVAAYAPWKINAYRYREHPRVSVGRSATSINAFNFHPWQFLDIDPRCRGSQSNEASRSCSWRFAPLRLRSHAQSDPAKVLRVVFRTAETGFDPQAAYDLYSNYVNRAIFEPPFRYDFRARPHKVVPNTAVALPESNKDGTEWTIRIKPGIYFTSVPG